MLDTHTFLWFAVAALGVSLPQPTKEMLEEKSNVLYLSTASVWETAIKVSTGKLNLPQPIRQIVDTQLNHNDVKLLDIRLAHIELVETMPFYHKDPFDRLLIAQALADNLTIVSVDPAFDPYGINRLWLT